MSPNELGKPTPRDRPYPPFQSPLSHPAMPVNARRSDSYPLGRSLVVLAKLAMGHSTQCPDLVRLRTATVVGRSFHLERAGSKALSVGLMTDAVDPY